MPLLRRFLFGRRIMIELPTRATTTTTHAPQRRGLEEKSPTAAMRKKLSPPSPSPSGGLSSAYFERKDVRAKSATFISGLMGVVLAAVAGSYSSTAIIIGGIMYGMLTIGVLLPIVGLIGFWVSHARRPSSQVVFCVLMGTLCMALSVVVVHACSITSGDVSERVDKEWTTMSADERLEWDDDRETLKSRVDKHLTGLRLTGAITLVLMMGAVWSVHLLRREIAWEAETMARERHNRDEYKDKLIARQMEARRVQIHLEAQFHGKAPTAKKYATLGVVSSQSRESTMNVSVATPLQVTPQQRAHDTSGGGNFSALMMMTPSSPATVGSGDEQRARERAERRHHHHHHKKKKQQQQQQMTKSSPPVIVTTAAPAVSPAPAPAVAAATTRSDRRSSKKKKKKGQQLIPTPILEEMDDMKHDEASVPVPVTSGRPLPRPLLAPLTVDIAGVAAADDYDEDDAGFGGADAPFTPSPEPTRPQGPQYPFTDPPAQRPPPEKRQRPPISPLQRRRAVPQSE